MQKHHTFDWTDKKYPVRATHWAVSSHAFQQDEVLEADFVSAMATVGEKNGFSNNEIHQFIKFALRLLRSNNGHAGNNVENKNVNTTANSDSDMTDFYTEHMDNGKKILRSTHGAYNSYPHPPFEFGENQVDEVVLATATARLARKNGLLTFETQRAFVGILRMLNSPYADTYQQLPKE